MAFAVVAWSGFSGSLPLEELPATLGSKKVLDGSTVYRLRQALKLDPPGTPVKVTCITQMLGEIKHDLLAAVRGVLDVFTPGGGYVFNPIHNVQHGVPVGNLLAMYETVRNYK